MSHSTKTKTVLAAAASLALAAGLAMAPGGARARTHHRHKAAPVAGARQQAVPQRQGVAGYFGPGAYGPYGYGPFSPGYGYGPPRGDLGFALLGALNGGGFRGFVECGNYYARTPGACGF